MLSRLLKPKSTEEGQQFTLSFWMRALPLANANLKPKFQIFSAIGNKPLNGQQTLLEVSYNDATSSVRAQVCRACG